MKEKEIGRNKSMMAANKTVLSIKFPDDTTICEKTAIGSLKECVRKIGFAKVATFKDILFKGYPLVGREQRTDGNQKWQDYEDGWFIYNYLSNKQKVRVLTHLSDQLHLGLVISLDKLYV